MGGGGWESLSPYKKDNKMVKWVRFGGRNKSMFFLHRIALHNTQCV